MQVTGYQLKTAIQRWELRRDAAAAQFPTTLAKFKEQTKESPLTVTDSFLKAERAVAALQTAQGRYNLAVEITVDGEKTSLAEGVKRVGGLGRIEKMWRVAAAPKPDRYGYDGSRSKENEYEVPTVTPAEALAMAEKLARRKALLTQAIAEANAAKAEVGVLDQGLLD